MTGAEHVKEILDSYLRSDVRTLESLDGALNETLMNFLRSGAPERQFVLEYLQNAIDAGSKNVKIVLDYDNVRILVYNDGAEFDREDFESFCKIARSRKDPNKMLIGYIGIGAKSAFAIARKLELHSGEYHVVFEEHNIPEELSKNYGLKYLWMIIPRTRNECYINGCRYLSDAANFKTVFVLEKLIKGSETLETVHRILLDPNYERFLDARTLLFIPVHSIKVEICILKDGVERCLRRIEKLHEKEIQSSVPQVKKVIVKLKETLNGREEVEDWLVMLKEVEVPEDIRRDPITAVFKRENVTKRLVGVAFRVRNGKLVPIKGVVKFSIFSYMPIREVESGFNYLLHADFLTDPGRGGIIENIAWNEWLRRELVKFLVDDVLEEFKHDDKLKYQTMILVPHVRPTDPFIYKLHNDIVTNIGKKDLVLTYNGFQKIDATTLLPKIVYQILTDDQLSSLPNDYRVKNIAHKKVLDYIVEMLDSLPQNARNELLNSYIRKMYLGLREIIEMADFEAYKGIKSIYQALWQHSKDKSFVKSMIEFIINDYLERNATTVINFDRMLSNLMVLTIGGEVKKLKDVYLVPKSKLAAYLVEVLNIDESKVKELLQDILVDEDLIEYIKKLCESMDRWWINLGTSTRSLWIEASAEKQFLQSFVSEKLFEVLRREVEENISKLEEAISQNDESKIRDIMKRLVEVHYPILKAKKEKLREVLKDKVKVKVLNDGFIEVSRTMLPESDWHSLKRVLEAIDRESNKLVETGFQPSPDYVKLRSEIKFIDLEFYQGINMELLKQFLLDLGTEFRNAEQELTEFKKRISEVLSVEIARIWLAKQGYFVPLGAAKSGWDIVALHKSGTIAKVEVKGTIDREYRESIALRCDAKEFARCKEMCDVDGNERCLIIIVENVARSPQIRIIDICKVLKNPEAKEMLEKYRIELPNTILRYSDVISWM